MQRRVGIVPYKARIPIRLTLSDGDEEEWRARAEGGNIWLVMALSACSHLLCATMHPYSASDHPFAAEAHH